MSIMPSSTVPSPSSTDLLSQSQYMTAQMPDASSDMNQMSYTVMPSDMSSSMAAQASVTPGASSIMQVIQNVNATFSS